MRSATGPLAGLWVTVMSLITIGLFAFLLWTAIRIVPGYFERLAG